MFSHLAADSASAPTPFPDLDVPWWIEPRGPEPEDSYPPGNEPEVVALPATDTEEA